MALHHVEKATVRKNMQHIPFLGPNMSILSSVFMCKKPVYSYYQKQVIGECLSGAVLY